MKIKNCFKCEILIAFLISAYVAEWGVSVLYGDDGEEKWASEHANDFNIKY